MGALDDLSKKAQDFIVDNKDKIDEVLHSEQAEDISDKILDGVEGAANKATGGAHEDKISDVRDNIDKAVGNE